MHDGRIADYAYAWDDDGARIIRCVGCERPICYVVSMEIVPIDGGYS